MHMQAGAFSFWTALLLGVARGMAGAASTSDDSSASPVAENVFHLDLSTMLVNGSVSLNYERTWDTLGIRIGAGSGAKLETANGSGVMVMALFFPAKTHSFDLGAGLSLMQMSRGRPSGPEGTHVYPAFTMCYRIQPSVGGFFLRLGFSHVYYEGTPFTVSIGAAF